MSPNKKLDAMWFDVAALDDDSVLYANSLGKALALAQSFEEDCKFVLTVANLSFEVEAGHLSDLDEIASYSERLADSFKFGRDVVQFRSRHAQADDDVEALRRGAKARNYIAHEAAHPLLMGRSAKAAVLQNLERYEEEVKALARAANTISCWSYEIQEKGAPPPGFARTYSEDVSAWILYELLRLRNGV
ncbi:MAG: hypothetical protein ACKVQT_21480 [Burkholderiales bacterium]